MKMEQKLVSLASQYSFERCKISNSNNGYAYMSCLILGNKNYRVLQSWDKLLQY